MSYSLKLFFYVVGLTFSTFAGVYGTEHEAKTRAKIIWKLDNQCGLTFGQLEKACIFIDRISEKSEKTVYLKKESGLNCTIEKSEHLRGYLLKNFPGKASYIGSGFHKVIRKNILCSDSPKIVAECITDDSGLDEIAIFKKLQGAKGIIPFLGSHVKSKKSCIFYLEYFPGGSLLDNLIRGQRFSPDQQLKIAQDITLGLKSMHDLQLIHRDLHPGNILLRQTSTGLYEAVLIDFGKTMETKRAGDKVIPQAPKSRNPPESLLYRYSSLDRYKVDVYALGTNFYNMLWVKNPSWVKDFNIYEMSVISTSKKKQLYEEIVSKYAKARSHRVGPILKKQARGEQITRYEQFQVLTFEMLQPNPLNRPSLERILQVCDSLSISELNDTNHAKALDWTAAKALKFMR